MVLDFAMQAHWHLRSRYAMGSNKPARQEEKQGGEYRVSSLDCEASCFSHHPALCSLQRSGYAPIRDKVEDFYERRVFGRISVRDVECSPEII